MDFLHIKLDSQIHHLKLKMYSLTPTTTFHTLNLCFVTNSWMLFFPVWQNNRNLAISVLLVRHGDTGLGYHLIFY